VALTQQEWIKREAFDSEYRQGSLPAMQAIERAVCGCAYGSTAWTTRDEAERIAAALELRPRVALLEIGAGSGWPALYLARETGCEAVLTDLPLEGLGIARERAVRDGVASRCWVACADGSHLPFGDESFDAINHSDLLCYLVEKRRLLFECLRVVRRGGRMAFSRVCHCERRTHLPPPGFPEKAQVLARARPGCRSVGYLYK
jgi:ubiquinone/menaquinone biosynthesis C-methylase UbiE